MNSKKKGNRVELFFAKEFTKRFKQEFRRVPASGAHGTNLANTNIREDAKEILSGDIITPKHFRFIIEIKSRANFNFWDFLNRDTKNEIDEWIEQVSKEAEVSNKDPLLIIKVNNKKPFILMKIDKYIDYDLMYKDYGIMRFDYFLKIDDTFFWER